MEAVRDQNRIPVTLVTSNLDGITPLPLKANPLNNALQVSDGVGGVSLSSSPAGRDENFKVVAMGVSSVDGVTPVEIYADSVTGALLINNN